jgi:hemerythrin-like metal-binding protein
MASMTAALEWNEAFSVGHPELGAEHRRMVDLIDRLCRHDTAHCPEERIALLRDLQELTARHFEHEESVLKALYSATPTDRQTMRETLATAQVSHAAEHRQRLSDLQAMADVVASQPLVRTTEHSLCEDLKAWFIDHAIGYEAQIKTIMQST